MSVKTTMGALIGAIALLVCAAAHAEPAKYERATSSFPVARCDTPPKIDGALDDPCWTTASSTGGFYRFASSSPVAEMTEAWACADGRNLYVAFHCHDSQPGRIRADETQRDGDLSKDDRIGVEIDSQGTQRGYSTFVLSACGTQFESMENGNTDNIAWAGDWQGAVQKTSDGWTAEFAIPYALLKYPRDARSVRLMLFRNLARETNRTVWPGVPLSVTDPWHDTLYMQPCDGLSMPYFAPRPVILPYIRAGIGQTAGVATGVDVKYPLSTTLTGVAAYKPDFQTIEQSVSDVNFSYTQKYVNDHRPFFVEGANYMPDSDLLYTPQIANVDTGVKVVGKNGPYEIGALHTESGGPGGQEASVISIGREIGVTNNIGLNFARGNQPGEAFSNVGRLTGGYNWKNGSTNYNAFTQLTGSWRDSSWRGQQQFFDFSMNPKDGKPGFDIYHSLFGADFYSELGYLPELNRKGDGLSIYQDNRFDKGALESYHASTYIDSWQHETGGFFHNYQNGFMDLHYRSGIGFHVGYSHQIRQQDSSTLYRDHIMERRFWWGEKTLLQGGRIQYDSGTQAGQSYAYAVLAQGVRFSRVFSSQLLFNRLDLGGAIQTQTVVSGVYHLKNERSIGGRLVSQDRDTNVYLSFNQKTRGGTDIYVLLGDPNRRTTAAGMTFKLVRAL